MVDLPSYPKIFNLGHAAIGALFTVPVLVEEKLDGSQFSFGKINGDVWCRSKTVQMDPLNPNPLFDLAVETALSLKDKLNEGWVYRGEAICSPKHNTLAYSRIPKGGVILFDVNNGIESYLSREEKEKEAERLGLEIVPVLYQGEVKYLDQLLELMDRESCLGGEKIEGMVFKQYELFGRDGKVLMGKHVSEKFKERNRVDFKGRNPTQSDIITQLALTYRTPARWDKAIQHLREAGKLVNEPRDIGLVAKEVPDDVLSEYEDEIKDELFKWAWPKVRRELTRGLAQYYKTLLMKSQFKEGTNE